MFRLKRVGLRPLLKAVLAISLLSLLITIPYLVESIPLLWIRDFNLVKKDPRLEETVKEILREEFSNNILYLYLQRDRFRKLLEEKTDYYVKGVSMDLSFTPYGVVLKLSLERRKPFATLNGKYLLSPEGVVFGFLKPSDGLRIFDPNGNWTYGETYNGTELKIISLFAERLGINEAFLGKDVAVLKGDGILIYLKRDLLTPSFAKRIINRLEGAKSLYPRGFKAEIFGTKGIYLKNI